MRLLVLGGTAWLGGYVAGLAAESGHQVMCLARGVSGAVPDGVRLVRSDRAEADAYEQVTDQEWDAVLDVSRQPGHVAGAVSALAGRAGYYLFVSTINVYADLRTLDQDEGSPLLEPLDNDVMRSQEDYGPAKVACEQHVLRGFGEQRSLIARAGLIGGPGDTSGRSGYWPLRFARPTAADGAVLVPDTPDQPIQLIDVRDLGAWLLDCCVGGLAGIFNTTGETTPLGKHLETARTVAGHTGPLVPADRQWLLDQGVSQWMGPRSLPLWVAETDFPGINTWDGGKARRVGLRHRPLAQTLADALAWELTQDSDAPRRAGLTDAEERDLLAALR